MKEDSLEGIYDTLKQCAMISKCAGGIGVNVHCIRAKGSHIAGTNGKSTGLVPMLRVYNYTATYVNQGGKVRFVEGRAQLLFVESKFFAVFLEARSDSYLPRTVACGYI